MENSTPNLPEVINDEDLKPRFVNTFAVMTNFHQKTVLVDFGYDASTKNVPQRNILVYRLMMPLATAQQLSEVVRKQLDELASHQHHQQPKPLQS